MAQAKERTDQPAQAAAPEFTKTEFRPVKGVHLAEAGRVALGNWVGRVGNRNVRVYRGAPAASLPQPVIEAMQKKGIGIGVITYEELGLVRARPTRGAVILPPEV